MTLTPTRVSKDTWAILPSISNPETGSIRDWQTASLVALLTAIWSWQVSAPSAEFHWKDVNALTVHHYFFFFAVQHQQFFFCEKTTREKLCAHVRIKPVGYTPNTISMVANQQVCPEWSSELCIFWFPVKLDVQWNRKQDQLQSFPLPDHLCRPQSVCWTRPPSQRACAEPPHAEFHISTSKPSVSSMIVWVPCSLAWDAKGVKRLTRRERRI